MNALPGILAALGWGLGDFLARFIARDVGAYRALFYFQFFGLAALTIYLVATGGLAALSAIGPAAWGWMALGCVLNVLASYSLFRAFEIGVLSLVSPIAASYGALTAGLAYLSGERLGWTKTLALGAVLVGVLLASTGPPQPGEVRAAHRLPPGVAWALVGSVTFGVMFWLLGYRITPAFGATLPIWVFRLVTPLLLALLAVPLKRELAPPRRRIWGLLAFVGLIDTGAFLASNWGLALGDVTLTTVLTSMFSAVTVLLAAVFLRERLAPWQWAGVAILLVGIPLTQI